jgi:hypothetical protein
MKKNLLAVVVATMLAGCAANIQYVDRPTYVPIPKALLTKCKTEQPPGRGSYPTLAWLDKEQAWTTYSTKQINDNTTCNGVTDQLIQWDAQQQALYAGASAPAAASAPGVAK